MMHAAPGVYSDLARAVFFLHALFVVWVVLGAVLRRVSSPSLVAYPFPGLGNLAELLLWPCPLTLLEN